MYNKIFTKILDSSVWLEPTPTRIVWITMIAAMDENGFCPFAAVGNVAGRARVTEDEARAAIQVLESPDKESSDQDNEGRRIERVAGGWMVLNAPKYRAIVTRANYQEKTRARVQKFRERKRKGNTPVTHGNESVTPSEAESKTDTEKTKTAASAFVIPLWIPSDLWRDFEEMRKKARKPMTDRARHNIVAKLTKLHKLGHSPEAVLNQSITNSWQDVFPLRESKGGHSTPKQAGATPEFADDYQRAADEADEANRKWATGK